MRNFAEFANYFEIYALTLEKSWNFTIFPYFRCTFGIFGATSCAIFSILKSRPHITSYQETLLLSALYNNQSCRYRENGMPLVVIKV